MTLEEFRFTLLFLHKIKKLSWRKINEHFPQVSHTTLRDICDESRPDPGARVLEKLGIAKQKTVLCCVKCGSELKKGKCRECNNSREISQPKSPAPRRVKSDLFSYTTSELKWMFDNRHTLQE